MIRQRWIHVYPLNPKSKGKPAMSVQYDLRLTTTKPELNSLSAPEKGTERIGIAKNSDVVYCRVFDSSGN
jgi:hypothetical protein